MNYNKKRSPGFKLIDICRTPSETTKLGCEYPDIPQLSAVPHWNESSPQQCLRHMKLFQILTLASALGIGREIRFCVPFCLFDICGEDAFLLKWDYQFYFFHLIHFHINILVQCIQVVYSRDFWVSIVMWW